MTTVFYDPATMQVMAVYKGCDTASLVWASRGYSRAVLSAPVVEASASRDATVILTGEGMVVGFLRSPNPEQPAKPAKTRLDILHGALVNDTITNAELREMLRLERGG